MSKYTLTIEGDFEKGDCDKCPLAVTGDFYKTLEGGRANANWECMFEEIDDCPLEEVKQGEWIFSEWGYPDRTLTCNKCGYKYEGIDYTAKANHTLHNFCPNCGADMRGRCRNEERKVKRNSYKRPESIADTFESGRRMLRSNEKMQDRL
jgi:hypothetical protein